LIHYPENSSFLLIKSIISQNILHFPVSKIDVIISKWRQILEIDFGHDRTLTELQLLDLKMEKNELKRKMEQHASDANKIDFEKSLLEIKRLESEILILESEITKQKRQEEWQEEKKQRERKEEERRAYLSSKWGSDKTLLELEGIEKQSKIHEEQQKIAEKKEQMKKEKIIELEKKFGKGKTLQELENLEQIDNNLKSHDLIQTEKIIKKMEDDDTKLRREIFD